MYLGFDNPANYRLEDCETRSFNWHCLSRFHVVSRGFETLRFLHCLNSAVYLRPTYLKTNGIWRPCGDSKSSFPSFRYRPTSLGFLVWFRGTLDRWESLVVKESHNNTVDSDESPLISRFLFQSQPSFWDSSAFFFYAVGITLRPANDRPRMWHHRHPVCV